MFVNYRDGNSTARNRKLTSGDGSSGNPDVMENHDPILRGSVGLQADSPAATPSSSASVGSVVKGLWAWLQANFPDITDSFTLLNAVTTVSTGTSQVCDRYSDFCFYWLASSVTSGGTVTVEAEAPNGSWHEIAREIIAVDTATIAIAPIVISAPFRAVRGRVLARTDGTYTLMMTARG